MESRRIKKIEELYRHEVARILLYEVRDPRLANVHITQVRVTPDMRLARVYFEMPEGKVREPAVQKALQKAKGYLKKGLSKNVLLRSMPELEFFYDETSDLVRNVENIFKQLEEEKKSK